MDGLHVLDVGCGNGDLLTYLRSHDVFPERYTGLDAPNLVGKVARFRGQEGVRFIAADFVKAPQALEVGADVVVFVGCRAGSVTTERWRSFWTISTRPSWGNRARRSRPHSAKA